MLDDLDFHPDKVTNPVLVKWLDAHASPAWLAPEDVPGPIPCATVGWLIVDEHDHIILAASVNALGEAGDTLAIPRGMLVSITELHRPAEALDKPENPA